MDRGFNWQWRSLPLAERTGSDIFERLFGQDAIATLLESPFPTPEEQPQLCRYSICAGVPRHYPQNSHLWTPAVGNIFPWLRTLLARRRQQENAEEQYPTHLPFAGGWLGWLGYDLAWEIETLPYLKADSLPFPVAYWYEPESLAVLDHLEQELWLASTSQRALDRLESSLENHPSPLPRSLVATPEAPQERQLFFTSDRQAYQEAVRQALKYIQRGDIFQANLSLRFRTAAAADSWQIYRNLQTINPSPFASYWRTPWGAAISCSPERLVQLQGNSAQTRPIAGTRPRGDTRERDRQLAAELLSNAKERAEHIMLIDLERNDLGRVCQWGSVRVDELLTVEKYSHVMHLVSNIKGILRPECDQFALIRALFPGGTITGCPKVRCMEIIEALEPVRRSLFYGSCGYLDRRGNLDLNILIRTLLLTYNDRDIFQGKPSKPTVWGQVGAGIVADSEPEREWHESLQKAQAQIKALNLTGECH